VTSLLTSTLFLPYLLFSPCRGKWHGPIVDGKSNGNGVQEMKSGANFRGDAVNDQREGYGVYEYSTGSTYRGSWKNDKMHGYGQYSDYTAEQIYDGGRVQSR
jgi:hypothetical protein